MSGITSEDNVHNHSYQIVTGPSIDVPGGHIHPYQGITSTNRRHRHSIFGNTSAHHYFSCHQPVPRTGFTVEEARRIGAQIGIDWSRSPFNVDQFKTGLDVELEHGRRDPMTNVTGDDPITTGKIALAHLN